MSVWETMYHHAREELESLLQRKVLNPQNRVIDAQIKEIEHEIETAKKFLQ
jgi:hypothetical protein